MTDETLELDPARTALVLIDLQKGVVGMPVVPHTAEEVVDRSRRLAERFRAVGATVVLVRVSFAPGGADALKAPTDAGPMSGERPADWDEIVPQLGPEPGDVVVTKRNWGAFYGTDLELQLRRRGVETIVLGGIATNFGVESTARDAAERAYSLVLVEDAMGARSAEAHRFAVENIFPRLGRVRSAEQVLMALADR
ncbi:MAG TPA: hydrolase [Longimicrobiaceae bacterium]|nr:hydrolase [Longimicrobiaceae bacterium]